MLESRALALGVLPAADRWRVCQVINEVAPSRWARIRLVDVARVQNGFPFESKHFNTKQGVPLIRIRDVGQSDTETLYDGPYDSAYLVQQGDILVGMDGEFRCRRWYGRPGLLNQRVCRVTFSSSIDERFGFLLLQPYLIAVERATSSITVAHLSSKTVEALELLLPPPNEQRRIVAKLEALQSRSRRAREALDAVPSLLEKLRQSILAAAFRGDLTKDWRAKHPDVEPASELLKRIRVERRKKWEEAELTKMRAKGKVPGDDRWKAKYVEPEPVDTTGLPELPEGWCWAAWRELGFCQNGRAFPSTEYSETGMKLLRPGNLHVSGELEWTDGNTRRMPDKWVSEFPEFVVGQGELVMNLTAQSLKDEFLGRVCLSGSNEQCFLNQRLARLTPTALPARYWLWFFKSPSFRRYVDTLNTGSLIQHMFTSQVEVSMVPVMPIEEADRLTAIIDANLGALARLAALVASERGRLPVLERALLAKAFRGELVPQDLSDEPAEEMLRRVAGGMTNGAASHKPEPSGVRETARSNGRANRKTAT
jgi:type I restriction enzyme S subunit